MKTIFFTLAGLLSFNILAKTEIKVNTNMQDNSSDEGEAIVIRKEKIKDTQGSIVNEKKYQVVTETVEIEGEDSMTDAEALSSWKKACEDWKKETRELNPGNLIHINCGKRSKQSGEFAKKKYSSQGTFTARVQIRD
jgi:hypothetical protein